MIPNGAPDAWSDEPPLLFANQARGHLPHFVVGVKRILRLLQEMLRTSTGVNASFLPFPKEICSMMNGLARSGAVFLGASLMMVVGGSCASVASEPRPVPGPDL